MIEPKISVVIPTYNRKNDLLECLESIAKMNYKNLELIVVDNASTDGTFDAVSDKFPNAKLLRHSINLGVTGGRNTGAKVTSGAYVLFVDHDVILDSNTISELVHSMESDYTIGLAGPIIYYYDDQKKIWAAGTSINMLTGKISFNMTGMIDESEFSKPFNVKILPAVLMVRKVVLEKVGLFDDALFAVYEDTDFCFRIRESGYRVVCVPKAKAWHKIPVIPEKQEYHVLSRSYYVARNRIIFMKKHATVVNFLIFLIFFVPIYAIHYTWRAFRRWRFDFIKEYWKGLLDGFKAL